MHEHKLYCDVDVVVDCTGYHSKKLQEKTALQVFFILFIGQSHFREYSSTA